MAKWLTCRYLYEMPFQMTRYQLSRGIGRSFKWGVGGLKKIRDFSTSIMFSQWDNTDHTTLQTCTAPAEDFLEQLYSAQDQQMRHTSLYCKKASALSEDQKG